MINLKSLLNLDYYVSPLDTFLTEFDKSQSQPSPSQQAEIKKYTRIYKLRNDATYVEPKNTFWDNF